MSAQTEALSISCNDLFCTLFCWCKHSVPPALFPPSTNSKCTAAKILLQHCEQFTIDRYIAAVLDQCCKRDVAKFLPYEIMRFIDLVFDHFSYPKSVYIHITICVYVFTYAHTYRLRSRYSDSLRPGRFGNRISLRTKFSAPFQTGP
jgi:hypothetical protein